jgi:hypothetical protein
MRIYSLALFDLGQPQHRLGCLFVFFTRGLTCKGLVACYTYCDFIITFRFHSVNIPSFAPVQYIAGNTPTGDLWASLKCALYEH